MHSSILLKIPKTKNEERKVNNTKPDPIIFWFEFHIVNIMSPHFESTTIILLFACWSMFSIISLFYLTPTWIRSKETKHSKFEIRYEMKGMEINIRKYFFSELNKVQTFGLENFPIFVRMFQVSRANNSSCLFEENAKRVTKRNNLRNRNLQIVPFLE